MIRLSCMTWPYANVSFERALAGIAGAGYRYVSFGLPHEGKPAFDDTVPEGAACVLRLLERYGLNPVTVVSTGVLSPQQPLDRAIQRMEFAMDIGVTELLSLGVGRYRRFPSEPRDASEFERLHAAFVEKFKRLGEEAGKRGLVISLKPHTGNTATSRELDATLRRIGSPHVKISYDPGNVRFYEGIDPAEDIPFVAADVVSLIAKDHKGARAEPDFPIPGEGDVDFPGIFASLRRVSFAGPVVLERLDGKTEALTAQEIDTRIGTARRHLERIATDAGFMCE